MAKANSALASIDHMKTLRKECKFALSNWDDEQLFFVKLNTFHSDLKSTLQASFCGTALEDNEEPKEDDENDYVLVQQKELTRMQKRLQRLERMILDHERASKDIRKGVEEMVVECVQRRDICFNSRAKLVTNLQLSDHELKKRNAFVDAIQDRIFAEISRLENK
jgi:hypothetical protein